MKIGRLVLRAVIGGLFIGHGTQKLFGWFGGSGLDGTTAMMESLEMRPARENAIAAGTTEALGGLMIVTGTLTPIAAAGLIATMTTAVRKVHFENGLWNSDRGYEYNLVIIAALLALVESGPGRHSVDGALGAEYSSCLWTPLVWVAGALGSTLAIEKGSRG